jgi:hypothetical protein
VASLITFTPVSASTGAREDKFALFSRGNLDPLVQRVLQRSQGNYEGFVDHAKHYLSLGSAGCRIFDSY